MARPDADAEVESYLSDPSTELSSLEAYPNIRQVYLKLNTGLPASAAVLLGGSAGCDSLWQGEGGGKNCKKGMT